jgi:hypothetical protein
MDKFSNSTARLDNCQYAAPVKNQISIITGIHYEYMLFTFAIQQLWIEKE